MWTIAFGIALTPIAFLILYGAIYAAGWLIVGIGIAIAKAFKYWYITLVIVALGYYLINESIKHKEQLNREWMRNHIAAHIIELNNTDYMTIRHEKDGWIWYETEFKGKLECEEALKHHNIKKDFKNAKCIEKPKNFIPPDFKIGK